MRRIASVVSILVILVGCAKEKPTIVAKVGNIEVTLREVEKRLQGRKFKNDTEELSAKKTALDKVIENKLFLLEAESRSYDEEEEFKKKLEDLRTDASIRQMYVGLIVDKIEASDEDVKEMWERQGEEVKARVITVETREEAEKTLEEIKAGADFGELAKERSIDKRSGPKGGDLGYFKWDAHSDEFSQAMFALNPGEMSGVVEIGENYCIMEVEARRKVEQGDFEQEKERLRETVTMRKRAAEADDFVDKLKERAGIVFDQDVLQWVGEKAEAEVGQMRGKPPAFTAEEKDKVIVEFDNQEWTIGEALEKFGARMPPFTDVESVKNAVELLIVKELLWQEARSRGVHKEQEVEKVLREKKEIWLTGRLRREASEIVSQPTDDELLEYYNSHKDQFQDREFEEVKSRVRVMSQTEARRQKTTEFIAELKEKYEIEIYEENLLSKKEAEEVKEKVEEPKEG